MYNNYSVFIMTNKKMFSDKLKEAIIDDQPEMVQTLLEQKANPNENFPTSHERKRIQKCHGAI